MDNSILNDTALSEPRSVKTHTCINDGSLIDDDMLFSALTKSVKGLKPGKILLIPPDFTRMHSGAGKITEMYYNLLKADHEVHILPALGTHDPMSDAEINEFFGNDIPRSAIINHDWRNDVVNIGMVPADYVAQVSDGLMNEPIAVEVNKILLDKSYSLIISIGQVVPHEVVGMANYSKNIFVGCGGKNMINTSHMLGAFYGMERVLGKDYSPVRRVFDYAEENFIADLPLIYVLTVTSQAAVGINLHGLFIGRDRALFEDAVRLSQEKNLTYVNAPLKKVVVFLDEKEFKSTWLGNKAIYRTRMAIADGGELVILAPGVRKFGEDAGNDALIRKYGYVGRERVLELTSANSDLRDNLSVAAHLIHGSSDGRFSITYASDKLSKAEIENVNFKYMSLNKALSIYNPDTLTDGFNILADGEEVFFVSNPALGLWVDRSRFQ